MKERDLTTRSTADAADPLTTISASMHDSAAKSSQFSGSTKKSHAVLPNIRSATSRKYHTTHTYSPGWAFARNPIYPS